MDRQDLRFNVLRNALYHTARRRSLEAWNRLFNFAVILLGTSAVFNVAQPYIRPEYIGLMTAAIGALQLVWDFGGKARDHAQLQREYYHLLAEIERSPEPTPKQIAGWFAEMITITGNEGPVFKAIDAKAYNDAVDATEMPKDVRLHIGALPTLFGGIFTFEGYRFDKLNERSAR